MPRPSIVVFDLGRVLLDWDPRHLYRKLFDDEARMEVFLRDVCNIAWITQLDHAATFAEGVAAHVEKFPEHADAIRAYDERWLETLAGPIAGSVAALEAIQQAGIPTYCITNYPADKFELSRPVYPFLDSFDGIVVSGRERITKPDPAIYRLLFERYDLDPADCIFIDDSLPNIETAKALGMDTHHFLGVEGLRAGLRARGLPTG